jgi:hypothetical protein
LALAVRLALLALLARLAVTVVLVEIARLGLFLRLLAAAAEQAGQSAQLWRAAVVVVGLAVLALQAQRLAELVDCQRQQPTDQAVRVLPVV